MRAWYSGWAFSPVPAAVPPMPRRRRPSAAAPDALGIAFDGPGIGAELLPQAHRHGVLQVSAPGFDDVVERNCFFLEGGGQLIHHAQKLLQPPERSQADGGGDDVVGGLRHVDVVVGVHPVLSQLPAQDEGGAVGDDLVGVHVVAGACPRLEGIDDKLVIPLAIHDLLGGLDDGAGAFGVEQTQVALHLGGCPLDRRHRPDESPPGFQARNREIEHGALRLDAPEGISRHLDFAQRIAFDTIVFGHLASFRL